MLKNEDHIFFLFEIKWLLTITWTIGLCVAPSCWQQKLLTAFALFAKVGTNFMLIKPRYLTVDSLDITILIFMKMWIDTCVCFKGILNNDLKSINWLLNNNLAFLYIKVGQLHLNKSWHHLTTLWWIILQFTEHTLVCGA